MTTDADGPDHLLLVEDNPGDLRLVEEAFGESRLETTIHAVSTGERAIEFVSRRVSSGDAPEPGVILLDWNLPKLDGEDVLREIRADCPDVPIVVMTGTNAEELAAEAQVPRADAYLTKPSDPFGYVDAVRSVY